MFAITEIKNIKVEKPERETIHSGHFMVSHFEAEEQDDEDNVAVPVPEGNSKTTTIMPVKTFSITGIKDVLRNTAQQHLEIDTSLSKLFQCMTLAYRQKLTSPKWNRFRGIRLRWKDKIRLNNVIWRCWHLQFIKKENTLICQFASPLDVDTHNKPEAVVLEGKYWKRKLHAVTAEYKKWRMFHRHRSLLHMCKENQDLLMNDIDIWSAQVAENDHMLVDEDYMGLMSDTLFSTITNQPFHFPDTREIAKAGLADFIQPSLGPLQPNLDDYMDTFEHDLMLTKLPTVPEEQAGSTATNTVGWPYSDLDLSSTIQVDNQQSQVVQYNETIQSVPYVEKTQQATAANFNDIMLPPQNNFTPPPSYQSSVISTTKQIKPIAPTQQIKYENDLVSATIYTNYQGDVQMTNPATSRIVVESQPSTSSMFKLPQGSGQGYKFPQPSTRPNLKFTTSQVYSNTNNTMHPSTNTAQLLHSQHCNSYNQIYQVNNEKGVQNTLSGMSRTKPRSRSSTREPLKRPPLLSTASDPALLSSTNSVLLSQLLTNSSNEANAAQNSSVLLTQLLTNNAAENSNLYRQSRGKGVRIKEEAGLSTYLNEAPTGASMVLPTATASTPSPSTDPLMLNSYSESNSPIFDQNSQCLNSPTSSQGSIGSPNRETVGGRDQRRVGHIHAEQKRRYNIKNGFDVLHSLIPHLNQNPNSKLSKAAMLQKGAEYIKQLRQEREQIKDEMNVLRQQIETLNTSISNCQSMLPTNVAPINIRRDEKMQELFDEYVRNRTVENWKYWLFSLIFRPLLVSFNNVVSTSSMEDLYRSTILWVEQHCTLGDLRPVVLNSLRYLCTKTEILSEPERLPDEARQICLSKNNS